MVRIVFNGSGGASDGGNGRDGFSAYQIALANGFIGTEEEWLDSLHGKDGKTGKAFTYADFTPEQLEALKVKGEKGDPGKDGINGKDGAKGDPGKDGTNGKDGFGTKEQYDAIIARLDALEAIESGGE